MLDPDTLKVLNTIGVGATVIVVLYFVLKIIDKLGLTKKNGDGDKTFTLMVKQVALQEQTVEVLRELRDANEKHMTMLGERVADVQQGLYMAMERQSRSLGLIETIEKQTRR